MRLIVYHLLYKKKIEKIYEKIPLKQKKKLYILLIVLYFTNINTFYCKGTKPWKLNVSF